MYHHVLLAAVLMCTASSNSALRALQLVNRVALQARQTCTLSTDALQYDRSVSSYPSSSSIHCVLTAACDTANLHRAFYTLCTIWHMHTQWQAVYANTSLTMVDAYRLSLLINARTGFLLV
jgi:hypothetical protein